VYSGSIIRGRSPDPHLTSLILDDKKKSVVANLYRYSDLSVEAIAQQVGSDEKSVQKIVDNLTKKDALELMVDQSTTNIEKLMSPVVISLDCARTPREAAGLMAENEVGSVVVTKDDKPFGIVTQTDMVRWAGKWPRLLDAPLKDIASVPLITAARGTNVEEAAGIMIKNRIHKLPIVDEDKLLGIVTITDLAFFLSPSRRPGLALSVFRAITRGK
jgi:CBS domain-containing protein